MKFLAILIGKLTIIAGNILHRGSSLPGKLALKIDKKILSKLKYPSIRIAVTGSSGKGSTSSLIASVLKDLGYNVCFNDMGSNLTWGCLTSFLKKSSLSGKIKADALIMEIDERYVKEMFFYVKPTHIVYTNITKDQPPRNYHVDYIYEMLRDSVNEEALIITNMDSPYMRKFELDLPNKISYFSIAKNEYSYKNQIFENLNTYYCPKCLTRLEYDYYNFEDLGKYNCPNCDFKYNDNCTIGTNLELDKKRMVIDDNEILLSSNMLYDAYNTVCAFHTLKTLDITSNDIAKSLNKIKNNKTIESFKAYQKEFNLLYCKCENAPTFNQALLKVIKNKDLKDVIIGWKYITIRYPYHDISWLYDISFELLNQANINKLYLIGISKDDLRKRIILAKFPSDKIVISDDLEPIKEEVKNSIANTVYGIFNYDYHEPFLFKETFEEDKDA